MVQIQILACGVKEILNEGRICSAVLFCRHTHTQQQTALVCLHFGLIFQKIMLSIQTLVLSHHLQELGITMIVVMVSRGLLGMCVHIQDRLHVVLVMPENTPVFWAQLRRAAACPAHY